MNYKIGIYYKNQKPAQKVSSANYFYTLITHLFTKDSQIAEMYAYITLPRARCLNAVVVFNLKLKKLLAWVLLCLRLHSTVSPKHNTNNHEFNITLYEGPKRRWLTRRKRHLREIYEKKNPLTTVWSNRLNTEFWNTYRQCPKAVVVFPETLLTWNILERY